MKPICNREQNIKAEDTKFTDWNNYVIENIPKKMYQRIIMHSPYNLYKDEDWFGGTVCV